MEKYIARVSEFISSNRLFAKDSNFQSKKIFAALDDICPEFLMIFDLENFHTLYFNESAKEFLGVNSEKSDYSFAFWMKLLHPMSLNTVDKNISNYTNYTDKFYKAALLVQSASKGKYTWIYTISKVISFTEANKPKHVCMIAFDIEEINKTTKNNENETNSQQEIKLTKREKNILKYICLELTSKEIAVKLSLSEATIESDRKSMIKKLGVKSMVGLVKYAIYNKFA